nr:MAG TPA: hypothetical protein [Bacteriophage sp.]
MEEKVMYDVRSALMTGEIKEVKKWETTTFRGHCYGRKSNV